MGRKLTVTYEVKSYSDLSLDELYTLLALRSEVFVVEQRCYYQDMDKIDQVCWHMIGYVDKTVAAYGRVIPLDVVYEGYVSLGRILVSKNFRGAGYGRRLVSEMLDFVQTIYPNTPIKISAQVYLIDFYNSFGFEVRGAPYLDAEIPHVSMVLENDKKLN